MKVSVVAFGIARDIIGSSKLQMEVNSNDTIGAVKDQLLGQFSKFKELASLSFAVNEEYRDDSYTLNENDEIVIIPPVSGG